MDILVHKYLFCPQLFDSASDKDEHILNHFTRESCGKCNQDLIRIGSYLYSLHDVDTCIKEEPESEEAFETSTNLIDDNYEYATPSIAEYHIGDGIPASPIPIGKDDEQIKVEPIENMTFENQTECFEEEFSGFPDDSYQNEDRLSEVKVETTEFHSIEHDDDFQTRNTGNVDDNFSKMMPPEQSAYSFEMITNETTFKPNRKVDEIELKRKRVQVMCIACERILASKYCHGENAARILRPYQVEQQDVATPTKKATATNQTKAPSKAKRVRCGLCEYNPNATKYSNRCAVCCKGICPRHLAPVVCVKCALKI